jgi:hypothetical protein
MSGHSWERKGKCATLSNMKKSKEGGLPAPTKKGGDGLLGVVRDNVVTALVSAVFGSLAAVATWIYNASVVSLNNDQRAKLAEDLAKDPAFQARVGVLSGTPVGTVIAWPSRLALPPGWALCDGEILEKNGHEALAKVLDTTYGSAGLERIQLPDFRGCFLRGYGSGSDAVGTLQKASVSPADIRWTVKNPESYLDGVTLYPRVSNVPRAPADGRLEPFVDAVENPNTRVEFDAETRPKNYAIEWIIRVR